MPLLLKITTLLLVGNCFSFFLKTPFKNKYDKPKITSLLP